MLILNAPTNPEIVDVQLLCIHNFSIIIFYMNMEQLRECNHLRIMCSVFDVEIDVVYVIIDLLPSSRALHPGNFNAVCVNLCECLCVFFLSNIFIWMNLSFVNTRIFNNSRIVWIFFGWCPVVDCIAVAVNDSVLATRFINIHFFGRLFEYFMHLIQYQHQKQRGVVIGVDCIHFGHIADNLSNIIDTGFQLNFEKENIHIICLIESDYSKQIDFGWFCFWTNDGDNNNNNTRNRQSCS